MTAVTLEAVKVEHARLAALIAQLERQPVFPITLDFPCLREGERYVGTLISADGTKRHHVILLPGEAAADNWPAQLAWAESMGGELPDRCEGALLFATLKDEFQAEAYWTREQHAAYADYAWCQGFGYGGQDTTRTYSKLRARAVRRVAL